MEDEVEQTVRVGILDVRECMSDPSSIRSESNRRGSHGAGIEGISTENSHWDIPLAPRVDAIGEAAGLDVDGNWSGLEGIVEPHTSRI